MATTKATKRIKKPAANKTAEVKKQATSPVRETTEKATTQQVIINRELKYKYPEGMTDTLERKAYRAKVRNKIIRLNAQINRAEEKEKAKLAKELATYEKEHLLSPVLV